MDSDSVCDKKSFLEFLETLRHELHDGAIGWENIELGSFLEAMGAWANEIQTPPDTNPWRHAAQLIWAGKFYE